MFNYLKSFIWNPEPDTKKQPITSQKENIIKKVSENPDFYYLALFKNKENKYGYSIHGLWGNYGDKNKEQLAFYQKTTFKSKKLRRIIKELRMFWENPETNETLPLQQYLPGDIDKEEYHFWEHEWKKHGAYMKNEMNEYAYFRKILELYKKLMKTDVNIEDYNNGDGKYMIPYDLNFNRIMEH